MDRLIKNKIKMARAVLFLLTERSLWHITERTKKENKKLDREHLELISK